MKKLIYREYMNMVMDIGLDFNISALTQYTKNPNGSECQG